MVAELTDNELVDLEERLFALLLEEPEQGDKNFWTVELVRPPGASAGLQAYIALTEAAVQSSVNLLGIGTTTPPPLVDDLIRPVVYENLGKSESTDEYQETLAQVEARQSALIRADRNIVDVSKYVSSEEDLTLSAIKDIVNELNSQLEAVGKGELTASQEMSLLRHLAEAIDAVQHKVSVVADLNREVAGSDGDSGDSGDSGAGGSEGGGSGSGGGGSGGGGIASMLPMLAMLPMAAMPLLSMVPDLLEQFSEDDDGDRQEPDSAPAPDAPVPTDPRDSGDQDPGQGEVDGENEEAADSPPPADTPPAEQPWGPGL